MRTILVAVLAAVILAACGNNSRKTTDSAPQNDGIEVLCFHGDHGRYALLIEIDGKQQQI